MTYFNPMLVCSLFNYQKALQVIFKENYASYPILNDKNQISPLIIALKLGNLNIAQILLKELSKDPEYVFFTKREMRELLNSKYEFTHKYLTNFMMQIQKFTNTNISIPVLSKLDEDMRIGYDTKPNFTPKKLENFTKPSIEYHKMQTEVKIEAALRKLKSNLLKKEADYRSITVNSTNTTSKHSISTLGQNMHKGKSLKV